MAFDNGPKIVRGGLTLALDAADRNSYPGSGTIWRDMSGNGFTGSLASTGSVLPQYTSSAGGNFQFDVSSSYINYGTTINPGSGDFAIDVWFRVLTPLAVINRVIIEKRGQSNTTGGWCIRVSTNNMAWENVTLATYYFLVYVLPTITSNTWNNVIVSRIGTTTTMYYNGSSVGTKLGDTQDYTTSANDMVSGVNPSAPGTFGDIAIGSVKLYSGSGLTEQQVLQNYNAQKSRFGL